MSFWDYRGLDKKRLARTGRQDGGSPADLARDKFNQGWWTLTVWRHDDPAHEVIGEITIHPDTLQREWWGQI